MMSAALPPRAGESPARRAPAGGVSRLAAMQARFQQKQLEEKEEKLIHMLEEKQVGPRQEELIQRVNYGRDSANSVNSLSSSASSNSLSGSTGQRPGMYSNANHQQGSGGRVRQMFEQRRQAGGLDRGRVSPIGWDKSHPLDPVEAVNPEMTRSTTGLYKQNNVNVARNNSYNKYSGNYGPRTGQSQNGAKRGLSLDRNRSRQGYGGGYGQSPGLVRAQSQANMQSFAARNRQPSGGSLGGGRYPGYEVSPDDSPPPVRRSTGYIATPMHERDYTRPLPPTYRREGRASDPSPSRHSYHDSAYSSHSSHSSDNPAFSVLPQDRRQPASTQSSPAKSYSRQNSFSYDANPRINSRTFRKQKSPLRNRSPSLSPSRSAENSDETDLSHPPAEEFALRQANRTAEREREEERRRMQVEMRKREQELLARIKEQQRELDAVKAEKNKVEKQLTRQEREREEERRRSDERERMFEEERERREAEEREETRRSEEAARRERTGISRPHERVLTRDKASPAHLRGRRPPSLNRLRGAALSREPSFDSTYSEEARDVPESRRARNRTMTINPSTNSNSNSAKTITVNPNNSVNIEIKGGSGGGPKKNPVPPSPAASKKTPAATRRSVFAPKPRDDLVACKHCQRNFAEDRVEKHEEICLKTGQKKRKAFDMTKARVKGTDAAKFVKSAAQLKAKEAKGQKQADWRKKREEFIATLRAAKEAQRYVKAGGNLKDLPPPPPMDTSDYIQCPHCERRFAEAAADRHIPKCKDIKSNKKR